MRRVLLCILGAVEGRLYLLEVLEILGVPEVMRCVLGTRWRLWRVGAVSGVRNFHCASSEGPVINLQEISQAAAVNRSDQQVLDRLQNPKNPEDLTIDRADMPATD